MRNSKTTTKRLSALWIVLFLLLAPCWAQQDKPYVLLISLDGFRYDYPERDHATNLIALGQSGVRAKALIPSFPTTTFPNHYTIVTGLYPAHHGIVDNSFWDPELHAGFKSSDSASSTDGRWWGGTPLWVLAEQQGMRAASFFWVGSDAEIQHTRPAYFYKYDGKIPNEQRVAQVVKWLKLPKPERPHFITLYFSDVDHEGHTFGPDAPQTHDAIAMIDALLGKLFGDLRELKLPLDIFVVSDHGMATVTGDIDISKMADLSGVEVAPNSTEFKFYSSDPQANRPVILRASGKRSAHRSLSTQRNSGAPPLLRQPAHRRPGGVRDGACGSASCSEARTDTAQGNAWLRCRAHAGNARHLLRGWTRSEGRPHH